MALFAKHAEVIYRMGPSFRYGNFVVNVESAVPRATIFAGLGITQNVFTPFFPIGRVCEPVVI
jgi:hypothetical protein